MISSSYQTVPLSTVVELMHQGINTAADKIKYSSQGTAIIQSRNFTSGVLNLEDVKYLNDTDKKKYCEKYAPVHGDILFSNIGTVGKSIIIQKQTSFVFAWNVFLIRVNHAKVDKSYLKYYLDYLHNLGVYATWFTGGTVKFLNKKTIGAIQVPLPPLETQKQIAAVLEKADQLRKDCLQMEQELNSLAQSVFIDMFGDSLQTPTSTLGEIAHIISGVTKGQKLHDKVTIKAPYMRVANVQAGYLKLDEIKEIEVKESDLGKYMLKAGDVLLTEGGDHDKLGRGAIWRGDIPNCIHQNHVFRVRLDESFFLPEWLNGYLKTPFAKRYFLKCAKKTTNLASINITQLKGLPMPHINIEKQIEFELKNEAIKKQSLNNKSLLIEANTHFNALMQKAFKGELNLDKSAS